MNIISKAAESLGLSNANASPLDQQSGASTVTLGSYTTAAPSGTLTKMTGCPVGHNKNSMTAGAQGPLVVQDLHLLEKLGQFNREKIPARNVHALGCGAYGRLTITNDITKYSCAELFSSVGKVTPIFARFSGIFTEQGDPDTSRDPRGFAIKFYSKEGNWDLMGINTPVFNVRDAKLGPDAVHACKRDPRTGLWNATQTWDFASNHPESLHQFLMIYSDRGGTPLSYRHMHAYGCHTFSLVNAQKQRFWVKFHILSKQGARGLSGHEAKLIAGEDPNFLSRDLKEAIEQGNYPKWRFCMQVMPEEEGYRHAWTFDPTKVWYHRDYPLIDIGEIVIDRNPTDYFAEVEQVAFAPSSVVPGIGLSPDKLLQGRLLIYDDTQYHRIGPNYKQLYINRPHGIEPKTMCVGGNMNIEVKNKYPHYADSIYGGLQPDPKYLEPATRVDGNAGFYDWPGEGSDADYYEQPRALFRVMKETDKEHLCENLALSFLKVTDDRIVQKMMFHLNKIDTRLGETVKNKLQGKKEGLVKKTEGEQLLAELGATLGHQQAGVLSR